MAARTTIYDVARAAEVSPATVSRALSRPDAVHPETLARVLGAAERLGYRKAPGARAGGARHTDTIAMVVPDITNPYYFSAITGAERRAQAAGLTLVLVNSEENAAHERRNVERLLGRVDGFVLASSRLPDEEIVGFASRTKVVLLNRWVDGISCAMVEQDHGSRQIVHHLVSLGHEHLVYLGGPVNSWVRHQRWNALRGAAEAEGVRIDLLGPYRPSSVDGGAAADAAMRTGATGFVAHNDLLAIGVLQRLRARGVDVPGEVSVVGYDDMFVATICTPALTTLGGEYEEAARFGVELLLEERRDSQVVLPSSLTIRGSTGRAPLA
ncbi:LacI family DNA-binding transcriptional regulator [Ornithinimicrobium tianjinense]|uniref:LacI family transcriptional regulator n=1 Tax=Ornithinimicrobium tianjinense TaxID=1195761 RepID=A0A917F394_9MICO|nr:LacI family DNA-binding transcriptional regulator [Ornithinimicrobium tianjinense]GGF40704.1 LacI family transcriptional regulator [Ornithinimicrobium tianjinense]